MPLLFVIQLSKQTKIFRTIHPTTVATNLSLCSDLIYFHLNRSLIQCKALVKPQEFMVHKKGKDDEDTAYDDLLSSAICLDFAIGSDVRLPSLYLYGGTTHNESHEWDQMVLKDCP